MSGDAFRDVDVDLLADYVDGALAGTPREATVAALVAGDPQWRAAHATLTAELPAVHDALRALGAATPAMPAELSARLDAMFTGPTAADGPAPRSAAGDAAGDTGEHTAGATAGATAPGTGPAPATRPRLVAVGGTGGGRGTGGAGGRRPRRLLRTAGPLAAAAAVLGLAAVGVSQVTGGGGGGTASSARDGALAGEAAAPAAGGALAAPPAADRVTTSDTDYAAGTLAGAGAGTGPSVKNAPTGGFAAPDRTAADLERLRATSALTDCLNAVAQAHDAGTIQVQGVEYARYAGTPAVLVRFTAANGTWVWASRSDCGTPGAGAATLASTRVR